MLQIFCNLIVPGFGTLFMRKFVTGTIQLLLMLMALILIVTVWLTFFGLVLWFMVFIWALLTGIFWYRSKKSEPKIGQHEIK